MSNVFSWMRLQFYRLGKLAFTLFMVDVFAVLDTCMFEDMLMICFCFFGWELSIDADLVDDCR